MRGRVWKTLFTLTASQLPLPDDTEQTLRMVMTCATGVCVCVCVCVCVWERDEVFYQNQVGRGGMWTYSGPDNDVNTLYTQKCMNVKHLFYFVKHKKKNNNTFLF